MSIRDWKSEQSSQHVADQPGLKRSLFLILLATFSGFILRSALTSDFVQGRVQKAANRIHTDLKIDFASTRFSLSDGIFPEFAVVAEGIRFESANTCWMGPVGEIDELRIPIDLGVLIFSQRVQVSRLKIGAISLSLRNRSQDCGSALKSAFDGSPGERRDPEGFQGGPVRTSSRGTITEVFIESLDLHWARLGSMPIQFKNLVLRKEDPQQEDFDLMANLNLGGLAMLADFSSHASIRVQRKGPLVSSELVGSWREGKYEISARSNLDQENFEMSGRIDHLPLSQILALWRRKQSQSGKPAPHLAEIDSRQIWLNMKFSTPRPQPLGRDPQVRVESLHIEGDLGKVEGGPFVVESWSPLAISKASLALRDFKSERVLQVLSGEAKPDSLSSFGFLNGEVRSLGGRRFELVGEFSDIGFVFSNRGERRTQTISLASGRLAYDDGQWQLEFKKIRPADGLFLGEVRLRGQEGRAEADLEVQVEELILSPEVQSLMTGGGSLGRWTGDIKGTLDRSGLRRISGSVFVQDLAVEGLRMNKVRASISTPSEHFVVDIQSPSLELDSGSRVYRALEPLLRNFPLLTERQVLEARDLAFTFESSTKSDLRWRLKPLTVFDFVMRSEGQWDELGSLSGRVYLGPRGREKLWRLQGHRDNPVWVGDTAATAGSSAAGARL